MKHKDCIRLAFRNLICDRSIIKKIIFGAVTVMTICICFLVIYSSYKNYTDEYRSEKLAKSFYIYRPENMNTLNYKGCEEELIKRCGVDEILIVASVGSVDYGDLVISIDSKKYVIESYDIVQYGRPSRNIIRDTQSAAFMYAGEGTGIFPRYMEDMGISYMIAGEYPSKPGQILLSSYLLSHLGYIGGYETLIGKTVSVNDLYTDYIISGIYDNDIVDQYGVFDGHIYVYPKEKCEYDCIMRGYYKDFDSFTGALKNFDIMSVDETCFLTEDAMEFSYIYWVVNNMGRIIMVLGLIICFIVIFSMAYLMNYYCEKKKKYYSMLRCIGMLRKDQFKLIFIEINLALLIAVLCSFYASFIILILFKAFVASVFYFTVSMKLIYFIFGIIPGVVIVNCLIARELNSDT